MDKELSEYEKIAKKYSNIEDADITTESLCGLLRAAVAVVRAHPEENDLFEDINLDLEGAVKRPGTNEKYNYLKEVSEELMGWEDIEAVLRNGFASNTKPGSDISEEAIKKRIDWCNYIDKVIAALSK